MDRRILSAIIMGADVAEVYSPERVTKLCNRYGLTKGSAMDLRAGYDFNLPEDRRRAWKVIKDEKHVCLTGSPECRMFCTWQNLAMGKMKHDAEWLDKFKDKLEQATRHVQFCCTLL